MKRPTKLKEKDSDGWHYDYNELEDFTDYMRSQSHYVTSMEEVEAVLLALDESPLPSNEDELWNEVGNILKETWTLDKVKEKLKSRYLITRKTVSPNE